MKNETFNNLCTESNYKNQCFVESDKCVLSLYAVKNAPSTIWPSAKSV
jgi:hypothetical protein